jgi:branched-chain amino acid transport system ATP-binding protein
MSVVEDGDARAASPSPSPAAREARLSTTGLTVRFGGVVALNRLGLSFAPAEVCGVIGPNGAGKTTLFDCISGVRRPNQGSVSYEGVDVTQRSATWRSRRGIRRTFQRQQTFGWLTVEENLLVALEWRGGGGGLPADLLALPSRRSREADRRRRAEHVLELCGLGALRREVAATLPIGRARVLELARAVVDSPRVLLLDEPTSGLEETETEALGQLLQRVRKEEGCTVVLVEHDVGFVMRQCDRIVVLNLGSVIAEGPPEQVRRDPVVGAAYLG